MPDETRDLPDRSSPPDPATMSSTAFSDTLPPLSPAESRDITKSSVISTEDIDRAGDLWRRYAGVELAGLWDAGRDDDGE